MTKSTQWWLAPGSWDLPGTDVLPAAVASSDSAGEQIVFIDGSVPDAQELAQGVKPGVVAVMLDPDRDGVQQIADWLTTHHVQRAAAIDIVSHGADGVVQLGSILLSASTIANYATQLAQIGNALQPGGVIQLYGCDVAQGANGVAFLQQLSQATGGANIAASSHEIGSAALGGSWDLNVDVGTVDVAAPFSGNAEADFSGVLPVATNQLFAAFNNGTGDELTRIVQTGVSAASTVGSLIDVRDGTQSPDFVNLQGLVVDAPAGKYFVVNSDETNVNDILEGNISGSGSPTPLYSTPDTADFGLSGLAIDPTNHVIYFSQLGADPSEDGIYEISETGSSATPVVTGLTAPQSLALDPSNQLIFITENGGSGSGVNQVDVYNISTRTLTVLNGQFDTATLNDIDTNAAQLSGVAVDPATQMLYFTAQNPATSADNYIFGVHYSVSSGSVTLGTVETLYAGSHAGNPDGIAIDTEDGIFYVGNIGNQAIDEGSLGNSNPAGSVSQVFQLTNTANPEPNGVFFLSTPTVSPNVSTTPTYAQAATAAAVLAPSLSLANPDGQGLATAQVVISSGFVTGDTLAATTTAGITSGFSNGTLTLSATGGATLANFKSVLDSVKFSTTNANPSSNGQDATRTISWTVNDGVIASPTPTTTLDIHAAYVTAGATATFNGGGSPVVVDSGLTANVVNGNGDFTSATVTVGSFVSGDTLNFNIQNGISETSFNNGTLILGGTASIANYNTALESITYGFTSGGDPTNGGTATARTISWIVNDGTVVSPQATSTLAVVHTAPTIQTSGTATYHESGSPAVLDNSITITTPDSSNKLTKATITITNGLLSSDTLTVGSNPGDLTVSGFTSGTLTLSGTSSATNYLTALESVEFSNSGDPTNNNQDTSRTISWIVNDGVSSSTASTSNVQTLCFCAGTRIATPTGEVPVEQLSIGDLVLTVDGRALPIRWVGTGECELTPGQRSEWTPVIIRAGALADGVPRRDLRVTKGHSLCLDGMLIPAESLINHRTILWDDEAQSVSVYHVELDTHEVLWADGAPAESYRDDGNRVYFLNVNPSWDVRPSLEPYAPIVFNGSAVEQVWQRLLSRTGPIAAAALTDAPDMHLLVDGIRLNPSSVQDNVYSFELNEPGTEIRLASRSGIPSKQGITGDHRQLGVAIKRIVLRQSGMTLQIAATSPLLVDGFHGYEEDGGFRWTNGAGLLPPRALAAFSAGQLTVEVHVGCVGHYAEEKLQLAA